MATMTGRLSTATKQNAVGHRIKIRIRQQGYNQKQIAWLFNRKTQGYLAQKLANDRYLSVEDLVKLSEILKTPTHWFITGEGIDEK